MARTRFPIPHLAAASIVGLLFAWGALPSGAQADGVFCGTRLIRPGDSPHRVVERCGQPDSRQRHVEYRSTYTRHVVPCRTFDRRRAPRRRFCNVLHPQSVPVQVDEWVYDFGPRRFVQHLYFVHGRLVRIEKGGYGHRE